MKTLCITIVLMLVPLTAFSQYENKEIIEHNGKTGVFIDEGTFTKIVQDLAEAKKLKEELIPALNFKIKELEHLNMTLELDIKYSNEMIKHWQDNYTLSEDLRIKETTRLRKIIEQKGVWYKSPAFTFSLGIVAGGALSVGLAWGFSNATNGYF